jgi:hypothetical protein
MPLLVLHVLYHASAELPGEGALYRVAANADFRLLPSPPALLLPRPAPANSLYCCCPTLLLLHPKLQQPGSKIMQLLQQATLHATASELLLQQPQLQVRS